MILDPRSQEVLIPDRSLGADQSLDSTFLQVVSTHAALLPPSPPTPQNGEFRSLFRIFYQVLIVSGDGLTSSSENVDN